jgi:hypothetical protein
MGLASAMAWVLFVIIVVMVAFIFRYFGNSIYYENNPADGRG